MRRGGGRIDLAAASQVTATLEAGSGEGQGKLQLRRTTLIRNYSKLRITVTSVSTSTVTYSIAVAPAVAGPSISASVTSLTVSAGATGNRNDIDYPHTKLGGQLLRRHTTDRRNSSLMFPTGSTSFCHRMAAGGCSAGKNRRLTLYPPSSSFDRASPQTNPFSRADTGTTDTLPISKTTRVKSYLELDSPNLLDGENGRDSYVGGGQLQTNCYILKSRSEAIVVDQAMSRREF